MTRRRRWLRRAIRAALALIALRLLLTLAMPWVVEAIAGQFGCRATYRSLSLSLAGLSAHLEDLELRALNAPPSAPPLLRIEDVRLDLAMTWLLRGELVVVDAVVAGGACHLRQRPDGSWDLPEELAAPSPPAHPGAAPVAEPWSFALPLQVVSARLHDVTLVVSRADGQTLQLAADLACHDLGRWDRPGTVRLLARCPGQVEGLDLAATVAAARTDLHVTAKGALRDAQLAALPLPADLAAALAPAALLHATVTGSLRLSTDGQVLTLAEGGLEAAVQLDGHPAAGLRFRAGPSTATAAGVRLPVQVAAEIDGLATSLQCADGQLEVRGTHTAVTGTLAAEGIRLRRLRPWLAPAGITVDPAGLAGAVRFAVAADPPVGTFQFRLDDLSFGPTTTPLRVAHLELLGTAAEDGIHLDHLHLEGPQVDVHRLASGAIRLAGIEWQPPTPAPTTTPVPAPASRPPLRIRELAWTRAAVSFTDAAHPGAAPVRGELLSATGSDLQWRDDQCTGTLRLAASLPDACDRITVQAACREQGAGSQQATLEFAAEGLSLAALRPRLRSFGIDPVWHAGTARATVALDWAPTRASLQLLDLRAADGERTWLAVRRASLPEVVHTAAGWDFGPLLVEEPQALVVREPAGTWLVAGCRLLPGTSTPTPAPPHLETTPAPSGARPKFERGLATIRGAALHCDDQLGDLDATLGLDATVGPGDPAAGPVDCTATLRWAGTCDELTIAATFGPERQTATLQATGLRGAGLRPWLPPGVLYTAGDGRLQVTATASTTGNTAAASHQVSLAGLTFRDADRTVLALPEVLLEWRQTPTELLLQTVRARGLTGVAAHTAEGFHLGPWLFAAQTTAAVGANQAAAAAPAPPAALQVPTVQILSLELGIQELVYRDRRGGEGAPCTVSMQVSLAEPFRTEVEHLDAAAATLAVHLQAPPVLGAFDAAVVVHPFRLQPELHFTAEASGIDTRALTTVAPHLANRFATHPAQLMARTTVHASLDLRRRDGRRFDFGRPFGGSLQLTDTTVQQDAATPLLHVASLDAGFRAIDLAGASVHLRHLEIDGIQARAARTPAGLAIGDLTLRPIDAGSPTATTSTPRPRGTWAIDHLRVSGVQFDWQDQTTTPPVALPLADLELTAQHLSSRWWHEPESAAFQLLARGAPTPLTRRIVHSSVVAGVVGAAAKALAGNRDEHDLESRPWLQELRIGGTLQGHPVLKGPLQVSLQGLELPALRGLARSAGVELNDGLVDLEAELLAEAAAGLRVEAGATFTWLSISEPPNGPISTYLKLPAPLDSVLFLLRNEADEQRIPVQFRWPVNAPVAPIVQAAAVEAVALAIATAVQRAPHRLAGAVGGLLGLGEAAPPVAVTVPFAGGAGTATLPELAPLAAALADPDVELVLTATLGTDDAAWVERRAEPDAATRSAAIAALVAQVETLADQRTALASAVAAAFAAAPDLRHDGLARLRELDQRLGSATAALAAAIRVDELQRPRDRPRRLAAAARDLAEQRLAAIAEALIQHLPQCHGRLVRQPPRHATPSAGPGTVTATTRSRPTLGRARPPGDPSPHR